jgi:hypothetical protein
MVIRGVAPVFRTFLEAQFDSVETNFTGSGECCQVDDMFELGDGMGNNIDYSDGARLEFYKGGSNG